MRGMLCVAALALAASTAQADELDQLDYYTEQYPPYNYTKNGELTGIAVDLIAAIFEKAGASVGLDDIEVVPWARGYKYALEKPGTVLFSTTRTKAREDKFAWVGPIVSTRIGIIGPKDAPDIESLDQLHDARIATIRDDVAEQLLIQQGVPKSSIHSAANLDSIIRLIESGRVDYWGYEVNVAQHVLKEHGLGGAYESKYTLKEGQLYYAFHKDTDPALIKAFEEAYRAVTESGKREAVLATYVE